VTKQKKHVQLLIMSVKLNLAYFIIKTIFRINGRFSRVKAEVHVRCDLHHLGAEELRAANVYPANVAQCSGPESSVRVSAFLRHRKSRSYRRHRGTTTG